MKYVAVIDGKHHELEGPLSDPFFVNGERHQLVSVNTGDTNTSGDPWRPTPLRTTIYRLRRLTDGEKSLLLPKPAAPAPIAVPTRVRAGKLFGATHRQVGPDDELIVLATRSLSEDDVRRRLRQLADAQDGKAALAWN